MTPDRVLQWRPLADQGALPILLVRHGETDWNKQRRFLGRSNVPLNEEGRAQARRLGAWLLPIPVQAIYTSPLARAHGTALALASSRPGMEPIAVADLTELDQGELEGQPGHVLMDKYPEFLAEWVTDPTHAVVPGGEALGACRDRSVAALKDLASRHTPSTPIVVVAHKMVISSLVCEMLGLSLRHYRRVGQGNTAINLLSYQGGALQLHRLNETAHLGQVPRPEPIQD